jgi:transposase
VDAQGRPLYVELTPGQRHEATVAESLLKHAQGRAFIGDTGYDAAWIREGAKARGMKPVIPSHPNRTVSLRYDKRLYRIRYRIECFFHRLKRCRRIATRFEKTARNYLALVHLACALVWLS